MPTPVNLTEVAAKSLAIQQSSLMNSSGMGMPSIQATLAYVATAIEQFATSGGGSSGTDLQVTGGAGQSVVGNNVLQTSTSGAAIDTKGVLGTFRSFSVQIVSTGNLSGGTIVFEGSNDNINFVPLRLVDTDYAWTNMLYDRVNLLGTGSRSFEGAIKHRYLRFRITTSIASGTVQAFINYSGSEFTERIVGGFPSANQILTANLDSSTGGTYVAPPAANLQAYFCGAAIASGGTQQQEDWWIVTQSAQPNSKKLGVFSSGTTTPESGNIYPPTPIPCGSGGGIYGYQNGGGGNMWTTAYYFIAP
ncbi:MAG: hypothetical protein ACRCZS_01655 [Chroococcidiopsis sp.]